ncbi:peptidase C39 family protein [Methanobrevibacter filiformis]|uniref:Peptidase C39 family protein n=1 Tax=Methanobrevibacter filiformis TaxID=55758 RepID=A0A166E529_9EURY|nr:peptidase C39 family protein [Methanobrevibacter filiformis]
MKKVKTTKLAWKSLKISSKKIILKNNKATVTIKTGKKWPIYKFTAKIDNQKLEKIFTPPCDLKVVVIATPNPVGQFSLLTYSIYIKNNGPGDALDAKLSAKFPKLGSASYSLNGIKWKKFKRSINIGKINKNKQIIIYIRGLTSSNFHGTVNNTVSVKNSVYDLKKSNNVYHSKVRIVRNSSNYPPYCGPNTLQTALASEGVFVSKSKLTKELKPNKKGLTSLYMMKKVANKHSLKLNPIQISANKLKKGDIALLKWKSYTHYVNILSVNDKYVTISDPIFGPIKLTMKDFKMLYSGYALSTEKKGKPVPTAKQKQIKGGFTGVEELIGGGAILIVVLAICALAAIGLIPESTRDEILNGIKKGIMDLGEAFTKVLINLARSGGKRRAERSKLNFVTNMYRNGEYFKSFDRCKKVNGSERVKCYIVSILVLGLVLTGSSDVMYWTLREYFLSPPKSSTTPQNRNNYNPYNYKDVLANPNLKIGRDYTLTVPSDRGTMLGPKRSDNTIKVTYLPKYIKRH